MSRICGTNNPGNAAHVNSEGQLETHSVVLTEQSRAGGKGELFNLSTGTIELTDDTEVPLFYFENYGENRSIKIIEIVITAAQSTGASGLPIFARLYPNPTSGTLLDSVIDLPLANYNIGSGNIIAVTAKRGSVGETVSNGNGAVPIMLPHDSDRYEIDTDSIVIPRGRSVAISLQASTGNTSMLVSAAINLYLQVVE